MARTITIIGISLLITGCTSMVHQLDSISGYYISYNTIPSGATVYCDGKELGTTPRYQFVNHPEKSAKSMALNNCYAEWASGARTEFNVEVPLDTYRNRVVVTKVLPIGSLNYEKDLDVGIERDIELLRAMENLKQSASMFASTAASTYNAVESYNHSVKELENAEAFYRKEKMTNLVENFRYNQKIKSFDGRWVPVPSNYKLYQYEPYEPFVLPNTLTITNELEQETSLENDQLVYPLAHAINEKSVSLGEAQYLPVKSVDGCYGSNLLDYCFGVLEGSNKPAYCTGKIEHGLCTGFILSIDDAM